MKKLKLIGLIVIILLIGLIGLSANLSNEVPYNSGDSTKVDITKENVDVVYNSGGSILEYDGYIYYLNVKRTSGDIYKNKICRKKLSENSKEEVIYNGNSYRIEDSLIIFNNNLFFSIAGETLFVNLYDFNIIKNYNGGVLYNIQNGKVIYESQGKIYRGEYYPKTLSIHSTSAIASANSTLMFEDENELYFYSDNKDNSKTIFSINKERQDLKVLERINLGDNKKITIIDYIQSENYLYIAFENMKKNNELEYMIRKISKDGSKIDYIIAKESIGEFIATEKESVYYSDIELNKLYEYNSKDKEIKETTNNKNDFWYLRKNNTDIDLYKNDEKIVNVISNTLFDFSNIKIEEIGEYIYIKFDLINNEDSIEEFMFWRLKKDGTKLERLNNTF